jgi:hypothetical protein
LPIRKEWDDLSGKLQAHFNLDELVGKRDDSIYRQAKSLLHELTIKTSTFLKNASKGGGLSCRILASLLMFLLTSGKNNKSKAPHTVGTDGMQNSKKPRVQCDYCKKLGHTQDLCRKKKADEAAKGPH